MQERHLLDTLQLTKQLIDAGLERNVAETLAETFSYVLHAKEIATKKDVETTITIARLEIEKKFESEMAKLDMKFETEILRLEKKFETEILRLEKKFETEILRLEKKFESEMAKLDMKFESEMSKLDKKFEVKMAELKTDLLKWMIGLMVGGVTSLGAFMYFLFDKFLK